MNRLITFRLVLTLLLISASTVFASGREYPVVGSDWKVPDIGMEFVWIKALDCWLGKYEVTNGEYRKFKPDHDSGSYENCSLNDDRQPAIMVTFDDAVVYARWLTAREVKNGTIPAGYTYRLPSGDEWTTFCQCGDNRIFPWGDTMPPKYGNYSGKEAGGEWIRLSGYNDGFPVSCPVEKSGMNDWGLYGVGGNVWECTMKSATDLSFEAYRGASWGNNYPVSMRSECRFVSFAPSQYGGFRLILSR